MTPELTKCLQDLEKAVKDIESSVSVVTSTIQSIEKRISELKSANFSFSFPMANGASIAWDINGPQKVFRLMYLDDRLDLYRPLIETPLPHRVSTYRYLCPFLDAFTVFLNKKREEVSAPGALQKTN